MDVIYDAAELTDPPLRGVDNLIVEAGSGDVLVAEDGGDMQIVLITADRKVAPLLQISAEPLPAESIESEVTGLTFSPDGSTLYFASQRGGDPQTGINYAVTGPFRGAGAGAATTTTTTVLSGAGESAADTDDGGDDGGAAVPIAIGAGVVVAGAAGAAAGEVPQPEHLTRHVRRSALGRSAGRITHLSRHGLDTAPIGRRPLRCREWRLRAVSSGRPVASAVVTLPMFTPTTIPVPTSPPCVRRAGLEPPAVGRHGRPTPTSPTAPPWSPSATPTAW